LVEEWRGQFPNFYTAADPDPNSNSEGYDPTWECFNIQDGAVATDDNTTDGNDAAATLVVEGNPKTPEHGVQLDPCLPKATRLCNSLSFGS